MVNRLLNSFSVRVPSRESLTPKRGQSRRGDCIACGTPIVAQDHAIQLAGGLFHAGCVLYRPREVPEPPPGARLKLQPSR